MMNRQIVFYVSPVAVNNDPLFFLGALVIINPI